jgi:hypothetical protein
MSKMGLHDPFKYLQHKLWPKEWPGKSQKSPRFPHVEVASDISLKTLNKGYNLL